MPRRSRYSPEVRERAVRLVFEHEGEHGSQWAAISSIAAKLGCTAETLRKWVRQAERDTGRRQGLTTDEQQRVKELERENRELKRANEILRKASAYLIRPVRPAMAPTSSSRTMNTSSGTSYSQRRPSGGAGTNPKRG